MWEREEQDSGRGQGGEIPASEKSEAFIKRHKRKQQTTNNGNGDSDSDSSICKGTVEIDEDDDNGAGTKRDSKAEEQQKK